MQIKNRLALYFTIISSGVMLVVMVIIYLLYWQQSVRYFYNGLRERAEVAAQLYLEADEISSTAMAKIKQKFLVSLPHEVIRIYDSADYGAFIADTQSYWALSTVDSVRRHKYIEYQDSERQVVGVNYYDNQGSYVILVSAIDVVGGAKRRYLLQLMVSIFIVQLLLQFAAGRQLASRLLRPLQKINAQVNNITATDLHLRVSVGNETDELGRLGANFNKLLQRLEESFDLQKKFVINASHELRTPITNIMGEADVALSKLRSPDEYQLVLTSILAEADRMNDVTQSFLLLANAELNPALTKELIRVDELLWELKDIIARGGKGTIDIKLNDMPEDTELLCLYTNKTFLSVAIGNVMQNAVKYADGKPATCTLCASQTLMQISIQDSGIGMDEETVKSIFQPFYRGAKTSKYQGYGVGLYIAQKLIQLLGGTIEVTSEPQQGSVFNIDFARKL